MAMSFFKQLSHLAKSVEKDLEEFRFLDHRPQKSEGEHEAAGQKAFLVANSLKSEVCDLKKSVEESARSLQKDKFPELVCLVESLVAKQKKDISQIENYLQQYGYQPLQNKCINPKPLMENDTTDQETLNKLQPCENHPNEEADLEDPNDNNNTNEGENQNAAQPAGVDYDEIMRMPKMEDFGLSEELLTKKINDYKTYTAGLRQGHHTHQTRTVATTEVVSSPPPRAEYPLTALSDVPAEFMHAGLCPTPGFSGGRDCTKAQGANIPLMTPQLLRNLPKLPDPQWTDQEQGDSDFTRMLTLPEDPVLLTPGIKQLKKLNHHGEPLPVLNMQDCDKWGASPTSNTTQEEELDSPAFPVLCTPGIKPMRKLASVCAGEEGQHKPVLSLDTDCTDIPEMPELTLGWIGRKTASEETTTDKSAIKNTFTHGIRTTVAGSTCTEPVQRQYIEDEPLPEMPELTSTFGFNWNVKKAQPMSVSKELVKEESRPTPDCPKVQKPHDSELSPQMPELTGTYQFSFKQPSMMGGQPSIAASTVNREQSHLKARQVFAEMESLVDGDLEGTQENKENEAPKRIQYDTGHSYKLVCRLADISEADYNKQPDYLQRTVSLDLLNKALTHIEQIFQQKDRDGQLASVTERDLKPQLESKTMSVLLSLTTLGRLKSRRHGLEATYLPAT